MDASGFIANKRLQDDPPLAGGRSPSSGGPPRRFCNCVFTRFLSLVPEPCPSNRGNLTLLSLGEGSSGRRGRKAGHRRRRSRVRPFPQTVCRRRLGWIRGVGVGTPRSTPSSPCALMGRASLHRIEAYGEGGPTIGSRVSWPSHPMRSRAHALAGGEQPAEASITLPSANRTVRVAPRGTPGPGRRPPMPR